MTSLCGFLAPVDAGTVPLGSMLKIIGPYFPASLGVGDLKIPWEFLIGTIWSHGRTCGLGSCSDLSKTSLTSSRGRARFKVGSVAARPCERKSLRSLAEDNELDVKMNKKSTIDVMRRGVLWEVAINGLEKEKFGEKVREGMKMELLREREREVCLD